MILPRLKLYLTVFFILICFIVLTYNNYSSENYIQEKLLSITKKSILSSQENKVTNNNIEIESVIKVINLYNSILNSEKKIYSQNGEDGILERLIDLIKLNKTGGYYVEFGTQDARECNTRYLREKLGWNGLLMDGSNENPSINLHRESIMHNNIISLLEKYKVPNDVDILSEDTDYADYHIVDEILKKYHPKILVHEVNQQPGDICVTVPKENKLIFWDASNYHGASVCAFWCLAKNYNYTMVYCDKAGVNCFWLRNDYIDKYFNINHRLVQSILNPLFLFKKPAFVYPSTNKQWKIINC